MANLKKFLIPVAAAIASLTESSSHATVDLPAVAPEAARDHTVSKIAALPKENVQRIVFATGDELHALLMVKTDHGTILADHQSHYSHSSHRSHYSGR